MKRAELMGIAALTSAVGAFLYQVISGLQDDVRELREASLEHSKALGTLGGEVKGLTQALILHEHKDGKIMVVANGNETDKVVGVLEYLEMFRRNSARRPGRPRMTLSTPPRTLARMSWRVPKSWQVDQRPLLTGYGNESRCV